VSDGADYQYKLTYIMTQKNKLGSLLGNYMDSKMVPSLVLALKKKNIEVTPYVNAFNETPDNGFSQFFDSPRYSTGYTSLFNTIGFVVETHMLKKYAERVKATYEFMDAAIYFTDSNYQKIKEMRLKNEEQYAPEKSYTLKWELDTTKVTKFSFLGFEAKHKKSEVTTGNRLYYDRTKPYEKDIPYQKEFKSSKEIIIPDAYLVPKSFWNIIELLKNNHISFTQLKQDTLIEVESYRISDYKTSNSAYEGHYLHKDTKTISKMEKIAFSKGDFIFSTKQKGVKYLIETLEPEGIDSFFNWNFFDTMLQQKEGYSDYVFEDTATKFLKENPKILAELEQKKLDDPVFRENPDAQLDWVYKHSVYYEKAHLQYPIYRILHY